MSEERILVGRWHYWQISKRIIVGYFTGPLWRWWLKPERRDEPGTTCWFVWRFVFGFDRRPKR